MSPFSHYFVLAFHVLVSVLLTLVVLVQAGTGANMGAAFGGSGSQTVFGPRGPATFLQYLTGGLASAFLLTSVLLA